MTPYCNWHCGSQDSVQLYRPQGWRCAAHAPDVLKAQGLPITPDPERTLVGLRRKAGLADYPVIPSNTIVDDRAIASGKRRSNPANYKAATGRVNA